jgi:hypothetical protein
MEDVLDVYQRPLDSLYPVVCMDEQPVQFIRETRKPLPLMPGCLHRYDYEYERVGTANNFLFTEPARGWRKVSVVERKTSRDWAEQIKGLLDEDYPLAKKVILVCDNLNTHRPASLYERYSPEEARSLLNRLEIHYTPKHGSWLNIAEIELSALTKQCLNRRIADKETLQAETKAWEKTRNCNQKGVEWRFTAKDARVKLKRLYPIYVEA